MGPGQYEKGYAGFQTSSHLVTSRGNIMTRVRSFLTVRPPMGATVSFRP